MTQARTRLVSLEETPFYHCYVRCVRRAFLCGDDELSGDNYNHRKQWLVSRIRYLSYVYAIDVCAYAIMSNHYHVVLHVDQTRAKAWSNEEVVERWQQLYNGNILVNRWVKEPASLHQSELEQVEELIETWRQRLQDISWFMRGINETIARMANDEDGCKGRFWEGRFKSQALLDDIAVLNCMAYVDLNPVRAGIENDLANSDYTSIQQRLFDYVQPKKQKQPDKNTGIDSKAEATNKPKAPYKPSKALIKQLNSCIGKQDKIKRLLDLNSLETAPLMPFDGSGHTCIHVALPFTQEDYFELVDTAGRVLREDKRGKISPKVPVIVKQLGIDQSEWIDQVQNFGKHYATCAGSVVSMQAYSSRFERKWCKGMGRKKVMSAAQQAVNGL